MRKVKRVLALIGVGILIVLYISTLICALSGSENFMNLLMSSIYATVVIPVLIWAYSFVYKLLKKHYTSGIDSDIDSNKGSDQNA